MNDPLVSVIIPTYNRQELILDTVKSVLRQSYKNLEVIVVSDGGTDDTAVILDEINDERLYFIQIPKNSGRPAIARNVGIKSAKGAYIAFCDDDDMWLEQKIATQMEELQKDLSLLCVVTNTFLYPDRKLNGFFLTKNTYISFNDLLLHKGSPICTSTVLLRKDILDKIGLFDESLTLRVYEDFDLWLRILKYRDHSVKLLKESLICYRVNNSKLTLSHEFETVNEAAALKYICLKHLPFSEPRLKMLSNCNQYSKAHHITMTSTRLYFGILSLMDIISDRELSLRWKLVIVTKYYMKRGYFYYFNFFHGKGSVVD